MENEYEKIGNIGEVLKKTFPNLFPIESLFDEKCLSFRNINPLYGSPIDMESRCRKRFMDMFSNGKGIRVQVSGCLLPRKISYSEGRLQISFLFGKNSFYTRDFMDSRREGKQVVVRSRDHSFGEVKFIHLTFESEEDAILLDNVFYYFSLR